MQTVSLSALQAIPGRPFGTVEQYSVVTTFRASTEQGVLLTTSVTSDNFTSSFIDGSFLRRIMAYKCEGQSASAEKQKKEVIVINEPVEPPSWLLLLLGKM